MEEVVSPTMNWDEGVSWGCCSGLWRKVLFHWSPDTWTHAPVSPAFLFYLPNPLWCWPLTDLVGSWQGRLGNVVFRVSACKSQSSIEKHGLRADGQLISQHLFGQQQPNTTVYLTGGFLQQWGFASALSDALVLSYKWRASPYWRWNIRSHLFPPHLRLLWIPLWVRLQSHLNLCNLESDMLELSVDNKAGMKWCDDKWRGKASLLHLPFYMRHRPLLISATLFFPFPTDSQSLCQSKFYTLFLLLWFLRDGIFCSLTVLRLLEFSINFYSSSRDQLLLWDFVPLENPPPTG